MFCADGVIRKLKGSSEGKPFSQKKSWCASKIDLQFLNSGIFLSFFPLLAGFLFLHYVLTVINPSVDLSKLQAD